MHVTIMQSLNLMKFKKNKKHTEQYNSPFQPFDTDVTLK